MRKNYWKELCLLLIGSLIGCSYHKHFDTLPSNKSDSIVVVKDTIVMHDIIHAKAIVPTLSGVKKELARQNIPHADIVLRQAILESNHFKSELTKTHNNIFGIRKNGQYKRYDSYIICIADYKRLFSDRYKGGDYYKYLLKIGYAEDPQYIEKLKKLG